MAVANETGIQQYAIEKATDGATFKTIGTVSSKGNNAATYHWLDKNAAPGNNYYRIKALEKDGQHFISKTVLLKMAGSGLMLSVFPNPVTENQLSIRVAEMEKGQYNISIVNKLGSQVMTTITRHTGGPFTQVIRFEKSLPKGIYYLTITNGSITNHQSFSVQ